MQFKIQAYQKATTNKDEVVSLSSASTYQTIKQMSNGKDAYFSKYIIAEVGESKPADTYDNVQKKVYWPESSIKQLYANIQDTLNQNQFGLPVYGDHYEDRKIRANIIGAKLDKGQVTVMVWHSDKKLLSNSKAISLEAQVKVNSDDNGGYIVENVEDLTGAAFVPNESLDKRGFENSLLQKRIVANGATSDLSEVPFVEMINELKRRDLQPEQLVKPQEAFQQSDAYQNFFLKRQEQWTNKVNERHENETKALKDEIKRLQEIEKEFSQLKNLPKLEERIIAKMKDKNGNDRFTAFAKKYADLSALDNEEKIDSYIDSKMAEFSDISGHEFSQVEKVADAVGVPSPETEATATTVDEEDKFIP